MKKITALIVDDEPDLCELLTITLNDMDIATKCAGTCLSAKNLLQQNSFDICLTDMKLPDGDGLDLLSEIQNNYSNIPTAVITAHGTIDTAIRALKEGAFDFISKPIDLKILRNIIKTALKIPKEIEPDNIINETLLGKSKLITELKNKIIKVSKSEAPILISGPSGSGKELVAKLIHKLSPRHESPFIAVNCGAIPHELMESEFFGYKKGSFTGANADSQGLIQAANGGILFLDEIAELSLAMQVKLLRVLQEKTLRPLGETKEIIVDIRILSATHKNLKQEVEQALFRHDLYYRINVINLEVPSLKARTEDIAMLAHHILDKIIIKNKLAKIKINSECIKTLKQYQFPGNVRELENILERAATMCNNNEIKVKDLELTSKQISDESVAFNTNEQNLDSFLNQAEKDAINKALTKNNGNKEQTAKELGISLRTLRYRLKKLGIE